MNEWEREWIVRKLVGGFAVCPWCGRNPMDRNMYNRRKVYASGTHKTKRLLRKGRAKVMQRRMGSTYADVVVCAHRCHGS